MAALIPGKKLVYTEIFVMRTTHQVINRNKWRYLQLMVPTNGIGVGLKRIERDLTFDQFRPCLLRSHLAEFFGLHHRLAIHWKAVELKPDSGC